MPAPRPSVQLYTVRQELDADLHGTLERLAALGLRNVEAFAFVGRAAELRRAFDAAGLAAPSGHAAFLSSQLRFGDQVVDVPPLEEVLDDAAELGIGLLIDPMVEPARWATPDDVARTAELLNRAAEKAAERGIRVGYHNHSQEFHHSFDGQVAYDFFVDRLDAGVAIELDAFWAQVGGQDVGALVARLGDRLAALHVKDGRTGVDPFRTGDHDGVDLGQVPAGGGEVALDAALGSATALELAVIEYDRYDGDVFGGIAGSLAWLAARGIR